MILRQDKGRGVVILDKTTYVEKCNDILSSNQFIKLTNDPTHTLEKKIQSSLRKIKNKFPILKICTKKSIQLFRPQRNFFAQLNFIKITK